MLYKAIVTSDNQVRDIVTLDVDTFNDILPVLDQMFNVEFSGGIVEPADLIDSSTYNGCSVGELYSAGGEYYVIVVR